MKESRTRQIAVCPLCGTIYSNVPAVSRKNNGMLICPDCGSREAMESIGINHAEQEKILLSMKKVGIGQ